MRLPIDVFPCEDGHAQERSLLKTVQSTIERNDAWIADRNFCTVEFTCGIAMRGAFFAIREHKNYPLQLLGKEKYIGKIETGKVYEQRISVVDIISNLSKSAANAKKIAKLYRDRWTIETAFQHLAEHLNSEINTLGYPRAALFGFCIALVAYIIMSVIKSALGSVHGVDVIEKQVSGYYIADEISATYRGMMIAIDYDHWIVFQQMTPFQLVNVLKKLAANVKLSAFQKHPRGPKKPQPKRIGSKNTPHVSTAKILSKRNK